MTIQGLHEFEMVRDYLYTRMRGVKGDGGLKAAAPQDGVAAALHEVAGELRAIRETIEPLLK